MYSTFCGRLAMAYALWLALSSAAMGQQSVPQKPVNAYWAAGAAAKYEDGKQPLAPILLTFAARYSAWNPGIPPEAVIQRTKELKRQMEDRNLPQKVEDLAALWDATGHGFIALGIRRFHRTYLQDSTEASWGGLTGFAKELAHEPGFWQDIDQLAANDPDRTGRVVSALALEYLGIDRSMTKYQIIARVPQLAADERIAIVLEKASEGALTAAQVRDAIANLAPEIGARLDRIKETMSERNAQIKNLDEWIEGQRETEARQKKIGQIQAEYADYKAELRILSTALRLAKVDEGLQRTIAASEILVGLAEQYALYAATGGSSLVLTASSISAFASLSGLLGQAADDPALTMLRSLDQRLDSLQQEMRKSFSLVHQQLSAVIDLAFQTYREVVVGSASVDATRAVLAKMQQDLWALEDRISAQVRELGELETTRVRSSCLASRAGESAISDDFFRQCIFLFLTDGTEYSLSGLALENENYTLARSRWVLDHGTAKGFRYLVRTRQAALPEVSKSSINPLEVPNPTVWAAGANDYLQFAGDWNGKYLERRDRREQLEALKQVGRKIRIALDELGGISRIGEQSVSRDPTAVVNALERYYAAGLDKLILEFDMEVARQLSQQVSKKLFESPPAFSLDGIPKKFPLCPSFSWKYKQGTADPYDPGPGKGLLEQLPADIDEEARKSVPSWVRGQAGITERGVRRINSISICLKSIVELTDRRTCRGGTYSGGSMPASSATAVIGVKLLKPTPRLTPYGANPGESAFETLYFESTLDFDKQGPCTKGSGLHWRDRIASSLPAFIAKAQMLSSGQAMERTVREKIGEVYISERIPAQEVWVQATLESLKAGTGLTDALANLDGARAVVNAYVSVAFPEEYANSDVSLLLAGDPDVRLTDRDVFVKAVSCLANSKDSSCSGAASQTLSSNIARDGWGMTLRRRAKETFNFLREATKLNTSAQSYALIDLTLARIEAALIATRSNAAQPSVSTK